MTSLRSSKPASCYALAPLHLFCFVFLRKTCNDKAELYRKFNHWRLLRSLSLSRNDKTSVTMAHAKRETGFLRSVAKQSKSKNLQNNST
ncbi:MAG: hypothetical protein IKI43_05705 [Campylobacter sp.]|nr:hypothetical protein [Campylobacter sp.]MBR4141279.1 hypothetical protein [Campylobacter sp.]MBR6953073.1 hypothetical protein [Campylobacter sp.]MBR7047837.1 hypothetical protein [Campylobacter sp.]